MKWFGKSWGAPINESCEQIAVPDGEVCPYCHNSIRATSNGVEIDGVAYDGSPLKVDYHLACFLRELGISNEPIEIN
jgi:hypothetical protein